MREAARSTVFTCCLGANSARAKLSCSIKGFFVRHQRIVTRALAGRAIEAAFR